MTPSEREEINRRFPDAPPSAYLTEEGWLVLGGEAWTEDEWRTRSGWHLRKWNQPEQSVG